MANVIKKATNKFTKGLVMDFSPENTQTEVLTHALNATLLTFNGNELSLQNDMGNARVETARLPEGYNTMLVSDGANLSQGQRQLLSIARAAVSNAPVMIMDEATSSIDTRTEAIVQKGMDALMQGRTVFVIAHRLSTITSADIILVMNKGQIVEQGTHEELLDSCAVYREIYDSQFKGGQGA